MPIEIFFSYAHEDEDLMNEVRQQLVIYEREGRIVKWHDREIPPGTEWESEIDERLRSADVILLFVSPAFIESRYCYDVEVVAALERHQAGEATVIPIILRPCAWEEAPWANLQALPQDGRPVVQWDDRDQVCLDVARAIIDAVDQVASKEEAPSRAHEGVESTERVKNGKSARGKLPGDRIARILVPFKPPRGINMPEGYQPRLNQIAARVYRESAVKHPDGGFSYPAQFRGESEAVESFGRLIQQRGFEGEIMTAERGKSAEIWFEYRGDLSPEDLEGLAHSRDLETVHCGAWLIGALPSE